MSKLDNATDDFEHEGLLINARYSLKEGQDQHAHDGVAQYTLTTSSTSQSAFGRAVRSKFWRLAFLAVALVLVISTATLREENRKGTTHLAVASSTSEADKCQDPYESPGFFLHDSSGQKGRWIPYTSNLLALEAPSNLPSTRNDSLIPATARAAFISYLEHLGDDTSRASDPQLQFLRGRTVLLLGCSVDRIFLSTFCDNIKGELSNPADGWHGLFVCRVPDLEFEVQLWFTFGSTFAPRPPGTTGDIQDFEGRVRDLWKPKAIELGMNTQPDLIIYSSGTWDILRYRLKLYHHNRATHGQWQEQGVSWDELARQRQRLLEMRAFIREEFPGTPVMYRPPNYVHRTGDLAKLKYFEGMDMSDLDYINESVYRMIQSSKALTLLGDFPIFSWSEKLIGHGVYSDAIHIAEGSDAYRLYGDMMLYYLKYYTSEQPSHCLL